MIITYVSLMNNNYYADKDKIKISLIDFEIFHDLLMHHFLSLGVKYTYENDYRNSILFLSLVCRRFIHVCFRLH